MKHSPTWCDMGRYVIILLLQHAVESICMNNSKRRKNRRVKRLKAKAHFKTDLKCIINNNDLTEKERKVAIHELRQHKRTQLKTAPSKRASFSAPIGSFQQLLSWVHK